METPALPSTPSSSRQPCAIAWFPGPAPAGDRVAVAIGTFDGVHRGHQAIVAELVRTARKYAASPVALTFEPHPRYVLGRETGPALLTPLEQRVRLLLQHGAERCAVLSFNPVVAGMSAEEFFDRVLVGQLAACALVAGFNFTFGKDRTGSAATLAALGGARRIEVRVVPAVSHGAGIVSSSAIRSLLLEGDVRRACELLGRPYAIAGTVVRGDGRGRALGFPTANVRQDPRQLLPGDGVYLARLDQMPALAVISSRPTFAQGRERWLEVHVLEGQWELYGRAVSVEFLERLRGIVAFGSAADLIEQVNHDREAARLYFRSAAASSLSGVRRVW